MICATFSEFCPIVTQDNHALRAQSLVYHGHGFFLAGRVAFQKPEMMVSFWIGGKLDLMCKKLAAIPTYLSKAPPQAPGVLVKIFLFSRPYTFLALPGKRTHLGDSSWGPFRVGPLCKGPGIFLMNLVESRGKASLS